MLSSVDLSTMRPCVVWAAIEACDIDLIFCKTLRQVPEEDWGKLKNRIVASCATRSGLSVDDSRPLELHNRGATDRIVYDCVFVVGKFTWNAIFLSASM